MFKNYYFFYITDYVYPHNSAHSLQSINTFSELSKYFYRSYLFVNTLTLPLEEIINFYGLNKKILVVSFKVDKWFFVKSGRLIHAIRNLLTFLIVCFTLIAKSKKLIIFIRSKNQFYFWGEVFKWIPFKKKCKIIFEAHDLFMFNDLESRDDKNFRIDLNSNSTRKAVEHLKNFDFLICVPRKVFNFVKKINDRDDNVLLLPNVSGIKRSKLFDPVKLGRNKITLGYFGSIDPSDGIRDLFGSLKYLGKMYCLTLVGNIKIEYLKEFEKLLKDAKRSGLKVQHIGAVPYNEIKKYMSKVDFLISPSGNSYYARNLRSPIKNFDYLAMGKPIIAARCTANEDIFEHKINCLLYDIGDVKSLLNCIKELAQNMSLANKIAHNAWEKSHDFNYETRAKRLIEFLQLND